MTTAGTRLQFAMDMGEMHGIWLHNSRGSPARPPQAGGTS